MFLRTQAILILQHIFFIICEFCEYMTSVERLSSSFLLQSAWFWIQRYSTPKPENPIYPAI